MKYACSNKDCSNRWTELADSADSFKKADSKGKEITISTHSVKKGGSLFNLCGYCINDFYKFEILK